MKEEQKYTLTLTESQLRLMAQCIEDCHRFASGQMELANTTAMVKNRGEFCRKLNELQPYMTPELSRGSSYKWSGIGCPDEYQRKFIARTYYIYREIYHQLRIQNEHDGYNVYDSPTLTCKDSGEQIKIQKV